mgnify:CR=1 FL=1
MRSVAFGHEAIDGLRTPIAGRGAGSFCNHADAPPAQKRRLLDKGGRAFFGAPPRTSRLFVGRCRFDFMQ